MSRQAEDLARLRWRCRRGMLELDLLLTRYLETAGEFDVAEFESLLEAPDVELLGWLRGDGEPAASGLRALVARMR